MRSIADALRREVTDQVKAMSVDERFDLVTDLAQADLAAYRAATGVSHECAVRDLAARRHMGRRHSRVAASFVDAQSAPFHARKRRGA